ncbi:MAG: TerC family protein [Bacteroidetes bacterium]|nr:TerC family protein [Bacteroidota bacterium]
MHVLFTSGGILSLVTLVMMEIVLGIDNIIFIAILCGFLPNKQQQRKARTIGLSLALIMRILLLFTISWIVHLTDALFHISTFAVSGRDMILFSGGVFLIYKAVKEIYLKLRDKEGSQKPKERQFSVRQAIIQITLIDIVFSFDSILTAVGLSNNILIMVTAVTISMFVMLFFAGYVSDFINRYPTIKMLALAFLVCIGLLLFFESIHIKTEEYRGYLYAGLAFSLVVELLNIRLRRIKHQSI